MLEAAFIAPVFFALVFGIMEIGLAMNNKLAVASTVRAGSRVASASGNDLSADLYTIFSVGQESAAIDRASLKLIVIYKPAAFGAAPSATCQGGASVDDICNVYRASDMTKAAIQVKEETEALAADRPIDPSKVTFGCGAASPDRFWCPSDRKVTQEGAGPDYVGVWIKVDHRWITKMFGNATTFTDQSVIRLEPRQS